LALAGTAGLQDANDGLLAVAGLNITALAALQDAADTLSSAETEGISALADLQDASDSLDSAATTGHVAPQSTQAPSGGAIYPRPRLRVPQLVLRSPILLPIRVAMVDLRDEDDVCEARMRISQPVRRRREDELLLLAA
jgi:hypothetical protein